MKIIQLYHNTIYVYITKNRYQGPSIESVGNNVGKLLHRPDSFVLQILKEDGKEVDGVKSRD